MPDRYFLLHSMISFKTIDLICRPRYLEGQSSTKCVAGSHDQCEVEMAMAISFGVEVITAVHGDLSHIYPLCVLRLVGVKG